jgi:hypothetical protein
MKMVEDQTTLTDTEDDSFEWPAKGVPLPRASLELRQFVSMWCFVFAAMYLLVWLYSGVFGDILTLLLLAGASAAGVALSFLLVWGSRPEGAEITASACMTVTLIAIPLAIVACFFMIMVIVAVSG